MPHRPIDEQTPQMVRSVQGVQFNFYTPYAAGDTLNGAEAASQNQTRCENIKNNVADLVTEEKKKAEASGKPLDIAALQEIITGYDLEYEFGMKRTRAGDPVESEAKDMAWELVKEALKKKGVKIAELDSDTKNKYISDALDKYPQIRERAQTVVAARQAGAADLQLDL